MRKIVIITTGQPSVNPRVVKEADALQAAGYEVTVLYCFWIKWAEDADKILLKKVKWNYKLIGGSSSQNRGLYFFTKARFKISRKLNEKLGNKLLLAERSQARCYNELLKAAKKIKADWYIGHNLGALPIAVKAAAYNRAYAGFDFEDYHRGENADTPLAEKKRIVFLEEKYVPGLSYVSSASDLITEKIKTNFLHFSKQIITLLNCFPVSQNLCGVNTASHHKTLKLFWFSQTIGKNRGLEVVIDALKYLNNLDIHLTLAGRYDDEMKAHIEEHGSSFIGSIHIAGIINPDALPAFAAKFDVGLAAELKTPLNRDICLTNKIFTYITAGKCIIASDTSAQKDFMKRYEVGLLYRSSDATDLAAKIYKLYNDRALLEQYKINSKLLGETLMNWETESQKLLKVIEA